MMIIENEFDGAGDPCEHVHHEEEHQPNCSARTQHSQSVYSSSIRWNMESVEERFKTANITVFYAFTLV